MKSILHIGMPKSMSTSIQAYLRQAENVFFMGIGPSKHVQPEVLLAFQRHIVRTPGHFYDPEPIAEIFRASLKQAQDQRAQVFAFSDETIPFPLGYARADTSFLERLMRLKAAMPEGTSVLMIVRKPSEYLKSTYKHVTVMNGTKLSYENYLRRLLLLGDTNLLGTLKHYHFAATAQHIFGSVKVLAKEAIEDDERELLNYLHAPGISGSVRGRLPRENSGMSDRKLLNFVELHAPFGDSLVDDDFNVLSPADRLISQTQNGYYSGVLGGAMAKEQVLKVLRTLASELPDRPVDECFAISDATRAMLVEYVGESNAMLKRDFGVDTDEYDYGSF